MAVHGRCYKLILTPCPASTGRQDGGGGIGEAKQAFLKSSYLKPTFCDLCGTMLLGMSNQGYQCKSCSSNAHEECRDLLPATCGVNNLALALQLAHSLSLGDHGEKNKHVIKCHNEEEKEPMKTQIVKLIKKNSNLIMSRKGNEAKK